jgi:hypothetical protein
MNNTVGLTVGEKGIGISVVKSLGRAEGAGIGIAVAKIIGALDLGQVGDLMKCGRGLVLSVARTSEGGQCSEVAINHVALGG